jgi:heptosyltransferase-1
VKAPVTSEIKKILVVKPSSLGDVVHSLPFLYSARRCFGEAEIHWVVASAFSGLLEGHPLIDRLWVIRKDLWKSLSRSAETAREIRQLFRGLRKERYDLAVDLQGLLRSGLITMASRATMRVGFREAREGSRLFYTHLVTGGRDVHAVDRYLKIASFLGCPTSEVRFPLEAPGPPPEGLSSGDYAVLVPGARWKAKRWPAERFGGLASMLPLKSVIVGAGADREIAASVVEHSGGKAVSLAGETTLGELVAVIKNASFMVCNDSGPMHIAAALGVPVFAVFGPTSPLRTGPYGGIHTVIREELPCAPCYRKGGCKEMKCLESITVERVYRAIMEKTGSPSRSQRG